MCLKGNASTHSRSVIRSGRAAHGVKYELIAKYQLKVCLINREFHLIPLPDYIEIEYFLLFCNFFLDYEVLRNKLLNKRSTFWNGIIIFLVRVCVCG